MLLVTGNQPLWALFKALESIHLGSSVILVSPHSRELTAWLRARGVKSLSLLGHVPIHPWELDYRHVVVLWDGVDEKAAKCIITARERCGCTFHFIPDPKQFSIWSGLGKVEVVCVPVSGYLTRSGHGVLGKGLALQAKLWFPEAHKILGYSLRKFGNFPTVLGEVKGTYVMTFPTKPVQEIYPCEVIPEGRRYGFKPGDVVPGFLLPDDPEVIEAAARALRQAIGPGTIYLPWIEYLEALRPLKDTAAMLVDEQGPRPLKEV